MPETEKRGVKRKRNDVSEENVLAVKLTGKLHHGLREVRKAAKKAKTFETQKLVKKLKALRSKDGQAGEVADLEAQLEALKTLDHEPIANTALKSKLKKDRLLSENEDVQTAITAELSSNLLVPATAGSPLAKVETRLLSSKIVAAEVHSLIDALRNVIQPKPKVVQEDEPDEADEEEGVEEDSAPPRKLGKVESHSKQAVADEDESGEEGAAEDGWESGSVDDVPDDGWESGSVRDDAVGDDSPEDGSDEDAGAQGTGSGDEDDSVQQPQPARATKTKSDAKASLSAKDTKGKSKAAVGESTFLPSLAVGFTRGDSDASDWSDGETEKVEKKNRRGQRARRAIWEKKYGKNANHVKKEGTRADADPRNRAEGAKKGWKSHTDARSTSTSHQGQRSSGPRSQFNAPASDKGWSRSKPPPTESSQAHAPDKQKQKTENALHPSWEAKRRLKEKLNPSIVPAAGKKIVF